MTFILDNKNAVDADLSASILLLRDGEAGIEVLMVERSKTLRFAPGAYVFPGGKIDPVDYQMAETAGLEDNTNISKLVNKSEEDWACRFGAMRELKEETAQDLLGRGANAASIASQMKLFAHWITPLESPKRFDTRFYLAKSLPSQPVIVDDTETVAAHWIRPDDALNLETTGRFGLMFPTRLNLMKLAAFDAVASALAGTDENKVMAVMPRVEMRDDGMWLTIPLDAGYPVSEVHRRDVMEFLGPRTPKTG
jgi:8-oxo-dGTP pyrophosphatase MutT (NUDIX family)